MSRQFAFRPRLAARRRFDSACAAVFALCALSGIAALLILLADVAKDGLPWLKWNFLTATPSRFPDKAGIKTALMGTAWLLGLTAPIAIPIGIGAAIYLEEFAPRNWLTRLCETNIGNLAGVPSIVYGLLGLTVFVRFLGLGRSVLAGAMTMALLVLPIVIVNAQEAIRAVPVSLRHASMALGATRWQTVRSVVLPVAMPGILTGTILSMSRAIGETAPLIMIGALTFIAFVPVSPLDPFTVLPIQIYNWVSRPADDFRSIAAAGIIVLMAVLLAMNALAVWLRIRFQRRSEGI